MNGLAITYMGSAVYVHSSLTLWNSESAAIESQLLST